MTNAVITVDAENTNLHGTYRRILKSFRDGLINQTNLAKNRAKGLAILRKHLRGQEQASNAAQRQANALIVGGLPARAWNNTSKSVPCREFQVRSEVGGNWYTVHAYDSGVTTCYCADSSNDKRGTARQCKHGQAVLALLDGVS